MTTPTELIESGLLELYLLGETNDEDSQLIMAMSAAFPAVAAEIEEIELALEKYAFENAILPGEMTRIQVSAGLDYMSRMTNGQAFVTVPLLTFNSNADDFAECLAGKNMQMPETFDNIHISVLSCTPGVTTSVVWAKKGTPRETHYTELESFLVLEGSCEIDIAGEVHALYPGDFLSIPLHKEHFVRVTSSIPCKVILQRVAA